MWVSAIKIVGEISYEMQRGFIGVHFTPKTELTQRNLKLILLVFDAEKSSMNCVVFKMR